MASIGGLIVYIMYFSVISKGWTLLDALSYIVHLYQQFGKEINQDLQLFLWDTCGNVFCIVSSSVIGFYHVLCVPKSNSFF